MDAIEKTEDAISQPPRGTQPPTQGYQFSGLYGKITFSFVDPLLRLGTQAHINEDTAADFFPETDRAEPLCSQFEQVYAQQVQKYTTTTTSPSNVLWSAFFRLYKWRLIEQLLWCCLEIGVRVGSPLLLRQLLTWFVLNGTEGSSAAPTSEGWMWASILAVFSYSYVLVHHQLFWRGMRMGMNSRMQAIAAVEAKALRLNAAAVADVTGGRIVNVVSNDVRRFDEAGTFWVFLICGPLELIIVLILVGLRLGFAAAVAGVATLLLLIPAQAILARYIGHLRASTASETDERVRLTGEAISGILACKMMAWEVPLLAQLQAIRTRETKYIRRMNSIRALNMALSYAITPVVSLITFATARYTGSQLTVANIFYALALLALPKLYMCEFFVHAVECVSELRVGVRRIAEFLALPEPPPPSSSCEGEDDGDNAIVIETSDFDWSRNGSYSTGTVGTVGKELKDVTKKVPLNSVLVQNAHDASQANGTTTATTTPSTLTLHNFQLSVRKGELLAIVGSVGSGKSSILSAILGELQPLPNDSKEGHRVKVHGTVAYSQQIPWIMSGTIIENVLFGLPLDTDRFKQAISAAALDQDLRAMPAQEFTEIGERGISISGGQKARLSLARAAYSNADIQLLDDPLSAVDPRVGRHLFTRCIGAGGMMGAMTRVLVTHQKQYLPHCDRILVVRGGRVVEEGGYEELVARGVEEVMMGGTDGTDTSNNAQAGQFASLDDLDDFDNGDGGEGEGEVETASPEIVSTAAATTAPPQSQLQSTSLSRMLTSLSRSFKINSGSKTNTASRTLHPSPSLALRRFISTKFAAGATSATTPSSSAPPPTKNYDKTKSGRLIATEDRAEGRVTWGVYGALLHRLGWFPVTACVVGLLGGQALYLYGEYWLSLWASKPPSEQQNPKWIWIYSIFAGSVLLISIARAQLFFWASLRAATKLHNTALHRLLHAPLSFFHTNPTGRVLNRFSRDQGSLDEQLPTVAFDTLQALMMVVGAFTLLVVVVPFILPIFIPFGIAFAWVQQRYLRTSRDLKRFEAVTRSPLYAAFSATLKGLPTIRAYGAGPWFRSEFLQLLTANVGWWFSWLTSARWIGFRLDLLVAMVLTVSPLLMMAVHQSLSPRLVGLALTQSLYLAGMLQWMVRQAAEVENNMTSAERLLSYCALDQEPPTVEQGGGCPPLTGRPPGEWSIATSVLCIVQVFLPCYDVSLLCLKAGCLVGW